MIRLRSLYHIARADYLDRIRRYSSLVTLGFVLFLGHSVHRGDLMLRLERYRGVVNSGRARSLGGWNDLYSIARSGPGGVERLWQVVRGNLCGDLVYRSFSQGVDPGFHRDDENTRTDDDDRHLPPRGGPAHRARRVRAEAADRGQVRTARF